MITPSFTLTASERVLPKLALDFTTASLDSRITFTRTTDATHPATYFSNAGVITAATNNQPRFDYDPITLVCKGLLIEESRVNSCLKSSQFDDATWAKGNLNTTVADATTAPDGTVTADKIIPNTTSIAHYWQQGITTTAATYTFSIYVKAAGYSQILIADTTSSYGSSFDVATGEMFNSIETSNQATPSIINAGNGWYRCSIVFLATAASNTIRMYMMSGKNDIFAGDGTLGLYLWGAQLEAGAFATSYIPTTTEALTRNADVAAMTGSNFSSWFNATKGSALGKAFSVTVSGTRPLIQFDDGTANNIIALRSNLTVPELYVKATTDQAQINAGTISANTEYRLSGSWATNSCAASVNSGLAVLDGVVTLPIATQARIGSDGTNYLNGAIKNVDYYDQMLTPSQIQVLTSQAGKYSNILSIVKQVI